MRKLSWFWLLFLIYQACTNTHPPGANNISGKISGAGGQLIYLEELTVDDLIRIDSVKIEDNGSFGFSYLPDEAGIFLLKLNPGEFVTFIMAPGDHIEILADKSTFPNEYKTNGNEGSKILERYFTETAKNQGQLDSLSHVFNSSTHLKDFYEIKLGLDSAFAGLFSQQQDFALQVIGENPNSLATLLLINQRFGAKKLFNVDDDFDLMLQIDSNLLKRYPGNPHVIAHHERVNIIIDKQQSEQEAEANLAPGLIAPNLNLPNPSGENISLQSLRGKLVLLYFWTTYSPPCRAANQQIKEIYQRNKSKGFEVYAVSFDHNKKIWGDVIVMEELAWINVSDLQGAGTPIMKLYNVPDELPFFYLLDREGKIITKNHSLLEIEKALSEEIYLGP